LVFAVANPVDLRGNVPSSPSGSSPLGTSPSLALESLPKAPRSLQVLPPRPGANLGQKKVAVLPPLPVFVQKRPKGEEEGKANDDLALGE